MNYLELCQELVGQFGLAGGEGPTSIEGQSGELLNVTRWVRDATLYVDNLWIDWRYLWLRYSGNLLIGNSIPDEPSQPGVKVRQWETTTLKIRLASDITAAWEPLTYRRRPEFDATWDPDTQPPGKPVEFTVMPDNSIQFNCPADANYAIKGGFWRRPAVLTVNDDEPLIPEDFHRIILVRAVVMYADREDAPELISGCGAEYIDLLDKLEGDQLDGFKYRRRSTQPEEATAQRIESPYGY